MESWSLYWNRALSIQHCYLHIWYILYLIRSLCKVYMGLFFHSSLSGRKKGQTVYVDLTISQLGSLKYAGLFANGGYLVGQLWCAVSKRSLKFASISWTLFRNKQRMYLYFLQVSDALILHVLNTIPSVGNRAVIWKYLHNKCKHKYFGLLQKLLRVFFNLPAFFFHEQF